MLALWAACLVAPQPHDEYALLPRAVGAAPNSSAPAPALAQLPASPAITPASISPTKPVAGCAADGAGGSASLYACGKRRIVISIRGLPPLVGAHMEYRKRVEAFGDCSVGSALLGTSVWPDCAGMMKEASSSCKSCGVYLDGRLVDGGFERLCDDAGATGQRSGGHTLDIKLTPLASSVLRTHQKVCAGAGPACQQTGAIVARIDARADASAPWSSSVCDDHSTWDGEQGSLPAWPGEASVCHDESRGLLALWDGARGASLLGGDAAAAAPPAPSGVAVAGMVLLGLAAVAAAAAVVVHQRHHSRDQAQASKPGAAAEAAPDERRSLVQVAEDHCARAIDGGSFVRVFEEHVAAAPDAPAYTWLTPGRGGLTVESSLSYAQLREGATALCVALRLRWGAQVADCALLIYPPGLDFFTAFFGCQCARAARPRPPSPHTRGRRPPRGEPQQHARLVGAERAARGAILGEQHRPRNTVRARGAAPRARPSHRTRAPTSAPRRARRPEAVRAPGTHRASTLRR